MSNCMNDGCTCTPNRSIKCTVNTCAHHCKNEQYCGLNSIRGNPNTGDPPLKRLGVLTTVP